MLRGDEELSRSFIVPFHDLPFIIVEFSRFIQDSFRNNELAVVMVEPRQVRKGFVGEVIQHEANTESVMIIPCRNLSENNLD